MNKLFFIPFAIVATVACVDSGNKTERAVTVKQSLPVVKADSTIIDTTGKTVLTRFKTPEGFSRVPVQANSFGYYLRNLPLKPNGAKVHLYNGQIKDDDVYNAVVDMDIGNQDLQQCADAIMRLRGEYLYSQKQYDKISFTLTNGFVADYGNWMNGKRIVVKGNNVSWQDGGKVSNTYADFRAYMNVVFAYAGTLSLSKSLKPKKLEDINVGDVFIKGGSPGHAVIVVDVAQNAKGEKVFMLAQSYMPAQEIHVLKNYDAMNMSPWYSNNIPNMLDTPEWQFTTSQLMSFE